MATSTRNDTLDCLRAVLVFSVIAYHFSIRWAPPNNPNDLYGYGQELSPHLALGALGVRVFFVLSGLFIANTLSKSADALDFFYRRMLRILPAFMVACTLSFTAIVLWGPPDFAVSTKDYFLSLLLVAPVVGAKWVDGAYWSLAVEISFYVWMGVAFMISRRYFYLVIIGIAFCAQALLPVSETLANEIMIAEYFSYFLFGIGLARNFIGDTPGSTANYISAAILFILHIQSLNVAEISVLLCSALVLWFLVMRQVHVAMPPIAYLGVISYEIYLVHQKIGVMIIGWGSGIGLPAFVSVPLAIGAVVGIAAFIHHVLQLPLAYVIKRLYAAIRLVFPLRPAAVLP